MSLEYPSLTPNFMKSLELPDYGVQLYEFDYAVESRRYKYSTGLYTRLLLEYRGRNEIEVANFINFYRATEGLKNSFTLPISIFQHPEAYRTGLNLLTPSSRWRFDEPPAIKTEFLNIYSFDVKLVNVLE